MTTAARALPTQSTRPAPRQGRAILVPSETTPGVEYTTSAQDCSCPSFFFGRLHDATFRCKHMIRRFPPPRLCTVCWLNPVTDLATCVMCAADPCHGRQLGLTAKAVGTWAPDEDPAVTVMHTDSDGYDTDSGELVAPTCPGYLREHRAKDGVICHWCAACDPEAVPTAVRLAA